MPVRVSIRGLDAESAWSGDPLVVRASASVRDSAKRCCARGIAQSGVALGAELSEGTRFLLRKCAGPSR